MIILNENLKITPKRDEIKELLAKLHQKYEFFLKKEQEKDLLDFISILKECLAFDPKERPDFIDVHCKRLNISKTEDIQKLILEEYSDDFEVSEAFNKKTSIQNFMEISKPIRCISVLITQR